MTDEEQTDPEETGIEIATGAGGDIPQDEPPDADAAEAARAAADEASDTQIENVKAGEPPSKALATPHGLDGDYDPVAEAENLPEPPAEEEAPAEGDAEAETDGGDDAEAAGGDDADAAPAE